MRSVIWFSWILVATALMACSPGSEGTDVAQLSDSPSLFDKPYRIETSHLSFWAPLGLKIGDEVISINQKSFSGQGTAALDEIYAATKAEEKVTLLYRRGGKDFSVTRTREQIEQSRRK